MTARQLLNSYYFSEMAFYFPITESNSCAHVLNLI